MRLGHLPLLFLNEFGRVLLYLWFGLMEFGGEFLLLVFGQHSDQCGLCIFIGLFRLDLWDLFSLLVSRSIKASKAIDTAV